MAASESEARGSLYDRVVAVLREHGDRDLETYLLALYRLVELRENEPMTEELFFSLLAQAFGGDPAPMDPTWLDAPSPPAPVLGDGESPDRPDRGAPVPHAEAVAYTKAVLRFQIADLHLMRGGQLDDELRYFGIDSPSGHRWYNFDPQAVLECGAAGLSDAGVDLDAMSWTLLGELLEVGRIFE